jgi:glycosyltransferase involved in cell wall biosynthesis
MSRSLNRIALLTSLYPAISQMFITREVLGLRDTGFEVYTCSINKPRKEELLTVQYRDEASKTFYIKASNPVAIAMAHLRQFSRSPSRYLSGFFHAVHAHQPGVKGWLWGLFYFAEAGILADWTERLNIGQLHVNFANAGASVAMIACWMAHLPFSIRVHGPAEFQDCRGLNLHGKFTSAQAVICTSDFCRSQVLRLLSHEEWPKIRVVRCGIDPTVFQPQPKQERRDSTTRFLCVARLASAKGLPLLLHACRTLLDSNMPFKCTLVGDGPDRGTLEALRDRLGLREHVCLVGAIGQDRIQEYYDQADVFVLPTFAEGLPTVLMEAMAKGLPIISTTVMGIPELVQDGVEGLLIPPANAEPLAKAMRQLAEDPQLRRQLGKAGREKVIAEYNFATNITKLAQILQYDTGNEVADSTASITAAEKP